MNKVFRVLATGFLGYLNNQKTIKVFGDNSISIDIRVWCN